MTAENATPPTTRKLTPKQQEKQDQFDRAAEALRTLLTADGAGIIYYVVNHETGTATWADFYVIAPNRAEWRNALHMNNINQHMETVTGYVWGGGHPGIKTPFTFAGPAPVQAARRMLDKLGLSQQQYRIERL